MKIKQLSLRSYKKYKKAIIQIVKKWILTNQHSKYFALIVFHNITDMIPSAS